jgi:Ca2+-binding RTX toxin-like protein
LLGGYAPVDFSINSDGSGGTLVRLEQVAHAAPSIDTTQFTLVNNADGTTTVQGLHVTDTDPTGSSAMTLTAATTSGVGTITPANTSGTLSAINLALNDPLHNDGVTYNPTATPASKEMIVLTVADSLGASDEFHFIFTPGTNNGGGGATLQGTSGKDVIFSTGGADTLIGGAGADQFVFEPTATSSVQDTIADFVEGIDKIDLREYPGISSANLQNLISTAQAAQANGSTGNDTLLTLDSANHTTVLLKNVLAASLQANDFIVHS